MTALHRPVLVAASLAAVLALLPVVLPGTFYLSIVGHVMVAGLLALSLDILIGHGGMTSLGHAVYLGVPAYAYAWLTAHAGLGPLAAAAGAVALGTALAAVFGLLALRASGIGFLMITLALGQIVWGLSYRAVALTGGDNGLRAARPVIVAPLLGGIDTARPLVFYYVLAATFLVALACLWQFSGSPLAACLRGTRDQPRRMRALGHNVWLIRYAAFVLAGFWGSVAGVLYVWDYGFVSPQVLNLQQSAESLLMVVLGGAGTLAGPLVGAAIITVTKLVVSSWIDRWSSLLGLIFIVSVIVLPHGIVPGLSALRRPRERVARTATAE